MLNQYLAWLAAVVGHKLHKNGIAYYINKEIYNINKEMENINNIHIERANSHSKHINKRLVFVFITLNNLIEPYILWLLLSSILYSHTYIIMQLPVSCQSLADDCGKRCQQHKGNAIELTKPPFCRRRHWMRFINGFMPSLLRVESAPPAAAAAGAQTWPGELLALVSLPLGVPLSDVCCTCT